MCKKYLSILLNAPLSFSKCVWGPKSSFITSHAWTMSRFSHFVFHRSHSHFVSNMLILIISFLIYPHIHCVILISTAFKFLNVRILDWPIFCFLQHSWSNHQFVELDCKLKGTFFITRNSGYEPPFHPSCTYIWWVPSSSIFLFPLI